MDIVPEGGRTMIGRRVFITVSVFFVLSVCSGLLATEWHVAPPPLGNDGNPGTNALPFATIQHGIDAASSGDTVIVAEGTYVENIQFKGKNIVLTSTDPLDPSVVASTIIDGNKAGSVVTFSGTESEACALAGFTIRNGEAVGDGGGVCGGTESNRSHAMIQNNTITENSAVSGGGLCYCDGTIQNNTIGGNSATGGRQWGGPGGGLCSCNGRIQDNTIGDNSAQNGGGLRWCHGTIRNNTIAGNSAEWEGGGLDGCHGSIQNNRITGNTATNQAGWQAAGGGLGDCNGTIEDNTITGNLAEQGGGLYKCYGTIQGNTIAGNSAQDRGGGLDSCGGTIQNNTVTDNWAASGGGLSECNGTIRNNTITANSAVGSGGGLAASDGTIRNCIIWANAAPDGTQFYDSSIPTYSCVQWAGGGEGNIALDPQFVDWDGPDNDPQTFDDNNYRLSAGSPCIDAGINEGWMWTTTDLDGNPRIVQGGLFLTVDVGAYEYRPFRISQILVEASVGLQLTWNSVPDVVYVIWSCTDLASGAWTQEATVPSAGNSTSWTDPNPGASRKFYRVEQL